MNNMSSKNPSEFVPQNSRGKISARHVRQLPLPEKPDLQKRRRSAQEILPLSASLLRLARSLNRLHRTAHLQTWLLAVAIIVFSSPKSAHQQTTMNATLLQGIEEFYSARFEAAIESLQDVADSRLSSQDDLFAAHIYLAFCYIRQNADEALIRRHFVAAIQANSSVELDPNRIPPDLFEQFEAIRKTLVGGLIVQTDPPDATAILVEPEMGRQINKDAPASFPHLLQGTYGLIISKTGYKLQTSSINVRPGATDTVVVTLARRNAAFYTRWWAWGGGLAFATAMLIYGAGEEPKQEKIPTDLPDPPTRP